MFPPQEVHAFQETSYRAFLATMTSFITYGIHVALGSTSVYLILTTRRRSAYSGLRVGFILTLLILGTINVALWASMMTLAWKLAFLPPDALEFERLPTAYVMYGIGTAAASLGVTVMCNGLLLYRCWVIWEKWLYIMVLPSLMYVVVIGLGLVDIILFWTYRRGHGLTPYPTIYPITTSYWFTLLPLNILLTLLIVGRILYLLRIQGQWRSVRGGGGGGMAILVLGILVESSLLYSLAVIIGVAFNWWFFSSVVFPRQTIPLMIAFEVSPFNPYLTHIECLASELILLRLALGQEWKHRRGSEPSSSSSSRGREPEEIRFRTPATLTTLSMMTIPTGLSTSMDISREDDIELREKEVK